jgi:hypothetical protein
VIELKNVFSRRNPSYEKFRLDETALIACALKSRKIYIIMLIPNGTSPNDADPNPNDPNSNQT